MVNTRRTKNPTPLPEANSLYNPNNDGQSNNFENARKRRKLERDFRRAVGKPVSDHESDDDDSSISSLTDLSDIVSEPEGFTDCMPSKTAPKRPLMSKSSGDDDDDDDDEEEEEWENVIDVSARNENISKNTEDQVINDLVFELTKDPVTSTDPNRKKGVSARERSERLWIHIIHVLCLLYHGYLRNTWLNDEQLRDALLATVKGTSIKKTVESYIKSAEARKPIQSPGHAQEKRLKKKRKASSDKTQPTQAPGSIPQSDLKLVELIGVIMRFWRKKFRITAPGLRKRGYRESGPNAYAPYGELGSEEIGGIEEFRQRGIDCHGSRDVGAQLLTALFRALGLEARMIFSLCPLGYGFKKGEMWEDDAPRSSVTGLASENETAAEDFDSDISLGSRDSLGKIRSRNSRIATPQKQHLRPNRSFDKDLKYPTFWTEIYSPISQSWLAVDPFATGFILSKAEDMSKFEPKGQKSNQQISYVIAYDKKGTARDVTVRYLTKKIYPGKTKGLRMPPLERQICDDQGEILMTTTYDMFSERMIMCFQSKDGASLTARDIREQAELKPIQPTKQEEQPSDAFPTSISAYKNHTKYVLERHLKREECLLPGTEPVHVLNLSKGEGSREEKVYSKASVIPAKPAENWYKEGRVIKPSQLPLKHVPSRAVTVNRKRAIEDAKREGDADAGMVGLYAFDQTELYRPPPIVDGIIPKNSFGNIDCFVSTMIPEGAAHVKNRNAGRLCRKLGIEYADAITGFEFKNKRAIPRAEGVLCAQENSEILSAACRQDEEELKKKADQKREQVCLSLWKKFLMGLRIIERLKQDYGGEPDSIVAEMDDKKDRSPNSNQIMDSEPLESGGFFRENE